MPTGVYVRTKITKNKMSSSAKKRIIKYPWTKPPKPFKKGHPSYLTEDSIKKIKKNHKGMLGKKHTKATKIKIGNKSRGRSLGKKSYWWKGGITSKLQKRCNSLWWKKLRKLIYKRDNWTCQICYKKCHTDIQCHHIIPERLGGNHKPKNLITLCKSCHIKVDLLLKLYIY